MTIEARNERYRIRIIRVCQALGFRCPVTDRDQLSPALRLEVDSDAAIDWLEDVYMVQSTAPIDDESGKQAEFETVER